MLRWRRPILLTRVPFHTCLFLAVSVACSNTVYDFFPEEEGPETGSGGMCGQGDCTTGTTDSGGSGGTGGTGGVTETGSGGLMGEGGDLGSGGGDPCQSRLFPETPLQLLRFVESGNCILRGEETVFIYDPGFTVVTGPCSMDPGALWSVRPYASAQAYRNEDTNLNLDVRFSGYTEGTPLVLFSPHGSFNQRFQNVFPDDSGVLLAAKNTSGMCLMEVNAGVEIWPCDATLAAQRIETVSCEDMFQ